MVKPNRAPANGFVAVARKVYNPIGFAKGYNFVLFCITFGGLMGFTLARLQYLSIDGQFCGDEPQAVPGECFYYSRPSVERVGIILHLGGILPASFLACWQFVPVIRHRLMLAHRINGYAVILLATVGTAGTFMVAKKAMGGALMTQAVIGVISTAFLVSMALAYVNIKRLQIEQHRAWMLRAWVYAACIITARPIMLIAAIVISNQGGFWVTKPCEVIDYMVGDSDRTVELYPACSAYLSGQEGNGIEVVAPVEADFNNGSSAAEVGAALEQGFSMGLWLAFFIHAVLVEVYLHLTPAEFERLRHVSYERQVKAGMRHPGRSGLTSDRLGDAAIWVPKVADRNDAGLGSDVDSTLKGIDKPASHPERV